MFKVFGAVGRLFRAMLYTLAGDVSKWSEVWETSTGYIHAEYDDIESQQSRDIDETTNAVAALNTLILEKEARAEELSREMEELRRKLEGAKAKAGSRTKELQAQGKTADQIKTDQTILKCLDWYENFKTTLKAKEEEAAGIEKDLERHHAQQGNYERRLQGMVAELKKIKTERHETVADIKLAQQEQKVNEALMGLKQTGTAERRQRIQELRRNQRSKADVQARVSGLVNEDVEAEFLEFATKTESQSEFFDQLGLSDNKETAPASSEEVKLPE